MPTTPAAFTEQDLRAALGQFATGVTIVTTRDPLGQPVGLTVSSFNSVSLVPPLVLWSLAHTASTLDAFMHCEHHAIHVLSAEQGAWAQQFATRGVDRFAHVPTHPGLGGVPLLPGCLATFECRNRSRHVEGDHTIFVGEVLRCSHTVQGEPLLYHRGTLSAPVPSPERAMA
jgi:flavin reductase (DIM6/NTAB) family NADH-FMN oxidoreductase RutF